MQAVTKLTVTLALGCLLGVATFVYAETATIEGDFSGGGNSPGDVNVDVHRIKCKAPYPPHVCASIEDVGPFDDNIFGVTVLCSGPNGETEDTAVAPEGGSAEICAGNPEGCHIALVTFFCPEFSDYCDDDYEGQISCGDLGANTFEIQNLKQLQNK